MFKKKPWRKACKKAKTERQKLTKQLDDLWRDIVKRRAGNVCEYYDHRTPRIFEDCNKTTYLNSHHIFRRKNMATRWDLENGICLCAGHHTLNNFSAHHSPEFSDWIEAHIGEERYNRIMIKSHTIKKWTIPEMKALVEEFKKEVKDEK